MLLHIDAIAKIKLDRKPLSSKKFHKPSNSIVLTDATATNPLYALNGTLLLLLSDAGIDNKYVCSLHYAT